MNAEARKALKQYIEEIDWILLREEALRKVEEYAQTEGWKPRTLSNARRLIVIGYQRQAEQKKESKACTR